MAACILSGYAELHLCLTACLIRCHLQNIAKNITNFLSTKRLDDFVFSFLSYTR